MMLFPFIIFIFLIISLIIIFFNMSISKKSFKDREKVSPFECGFDPISNNNLPFSLQFFLISLIFLIFDIEITLIIPFIYMLSFMNIYLLFSSIFIIITLIMGLFLEYMEKSLDWKI